MELQPEWHEFLRALKRHGVRFLLVGAHALAAHGRPRYTQDLDVLVDPTPANARRVSAAIAEFGFEETARDWRWFSEPYHITMMGKIPLRIDVLTSISGVSFRTAWRNRKLRERARVRPGDTVEFLDSDDPDVIVMRRLTRRPNEGLVDALLACPHRFEVLKRRREYPKKIEL